MISLLSQHLFEYSWREIETSMRHDKNKNILFSQPLYTLTVNIQRVRERGSFRVSANASELFISNTPLAHFSLFIFIFFPPRVYILVAMRRFALNAVRFVASNNIFMVETCVKYSGVIFFSVHMTLMTLRSCGDFWYRGLDWKVFINRRIFIVRWDYTGNSLIVLFIQLFNKVRTMR